MLDMTGSTLRNWSASAPDAALKKVSVIVVGIVCIDISGLHDASEIALAGPASMDPDPVWLLLADV